MASLAFIGSCGLDELSGPGPTKSYSVQVIGDSLGVIRLGGRRGLRVQVDPAPTDSTGYRIEWLVSDPKTLFAVMPVGVDSFEVHGLEVGQTEVRARLIAPDLPEPIESEPFDVGVRYADLHLETDLTTFASKGEPTAIKVRGLDVDGGDRGAVSLPVTSSAPAIVSVAGSTATALKDGTAYLIVASAEGDLRDSLLLTVDQVATSVTLPALWTLPALELDSGPVPLTVRDARGQLVDSYAATWTSGSPGNVSVSPAGVVTGHSPNSSAEIVATVDGASDSILVQVQQRVAALQVVQGDGQVDTVGQALPTQLKVRAVDAGGSAVPEVAVKFERPDGSTGGLTAPNASTDPSGVATLEGWTLKTATGPDSVRARHQPPGGGGPVISGFVVASAVPDAPTELAATIPLTGSATVGSTLAVDSIPGIRVRDRYQNLIAGLPVTFAVTAGGGGLSGGSAVTGVDGIARVGSWTLGTVAGPNQLSATVAGLSPVLFDRTGVPAAPFAIIRVSGDSQTVSAGDSTALPLSVKVVDQYGNGIPGAAVTFAPVTGGVASPSVQTDASGAASGGRWFPGTVAAGQVVNVSAGALSAQFHATVVAGAPASLVLENPADATVVVGSTLVPVAHVADGFGNPVAAASVTFAVTQGTSSINVPNTGLTAADGNVTVGVWSLGTAVGTQELTVTSGTLTAVLTRETTPDVPAAIVTVTGAGQSVSAGATVPVDPSVRVVDQYGNGIDGVVVQATASQGSVVNFSLGTTGGGFATFGQWDPGTEAGISRLVVNGGGLADTIFATVAPDVPASLLLTNDSVANATVGSQVVPSVTLTDRFGNPISGAAVAFAVTQGGGSLSAPSAITDASGVAAISGWTLDSTVGVNGLTVSVGGLSDVLTRQGVADAPSRLVIISGDGETVIAGDSTAVPIEIRVTDRFGNGVSGEAITVIPSAGGVVSPTPSTDATGGASAGRWFPGTLAGVRTLYATSGALADTITATVTADLPTEITAAGSLDADSSATLAVGSTLIPVATVTDRFGNPVPGFQVAFSVTSGSGELAAPTTPTTDAAGRATAGTWTLDTLVGANVVTVTAGAASTQLVRNGIADAAAHLDLVDLAAADVAVGRTISGLRVRVTDRFGNPVPGQVLPVTLLEGGGSVAAPGHATSDPSGIATLPDWTLGPTPGQNRIEIPLGSVDSVIYTRQGVVTSLARIVWVSGDSQSVAAGDSTAAELVARAEDSSGAPLSGIVVGFGRVGAGAPTVVDTTGADGLASGGRWYGDTLTGDVEVDAASEGFSYRFTIHVLPAAPAEVRLSGPVASVVAGQEITGPSVSVTDRYGNLVSTYDGDITFAVVDTADVRWSDNVSTPAPGGGGGPIFGMVVVRPGVGYRIRLTATGVPGPQYSAPFDVDAGIILVTATAGDDTLHYVGDTTTIAVAAVNAYIPVAGLPVTWWLSDSTRATIDTTGRLTATLPGSVQVTATVDGVSGSVDVVIEQVPATVTLTPADTTLAAPGDTARLVATVVDSGGTVVTAPALNWASSNGAVATVAGGLVTATGTGEAWITASSGGAVDSSRIVVLGDALSRFGTLVFTRSTPADPTTEEIYLVPSVGAAPVRLSNNAFQEIDPGLSPDGSRVIFASKETGNFEVWSMNADGTGRTQLTSNGGSNTRPVWSPDGRHIAWSKDGHLMVMLADGTGQMERAAAVTGRMDWLDDTTLVFGDGTGVVAVALDTLGAARPLATGYGGGVDVSVSHDRGRFAVSSSDRALYLFDSAGTALSGPIGAVGTVNESAWSDDDERIFYTYFQSGYGVGLVAISPDGAVTDTLALPSEAARFAGRVPGVGAPTSGTPATATVTLASDTLAVGGTTTASAVLRDFSYRVTTGTPTWHTSDAAIATVDAGGVVTGVSSGVVEVWATVGVRASNHVRLIVGLTGFVYWSNASTGNGNSVGDLYRWDGPAGPSVQLTTLGTVELGAVGFSPTGRSLLFTRRVGGAREIASLDLATQAVTSMISGGDNILPSWSRRGSYVAWAKDGALWVMNADASGQHRLAGGTVLSVDWLDDTTIVYATSGGVFKVRADGTPDLDVVPVASVGGSYHQAAASPDGEWIVFRGSDVNLWKVRPDASGLVQLTFTGTGSYGEGGPTWSSDGAAILTTTNGLPPSGSVPRGIAVFRADGSARTELIPVGGFDRNGVTMPRTPLSVGSVTLTPDTVRLSAVADSARLALNAVATDGGPIRGLTTWTSSDTLVAKVTAGLVEATGLGTATITATVEGVSRQATVVVATPSSFAGLGAVVFSESFYDSLTTPTNADEEIVYADGSGAPPRRLTVNRKQDVFPSLSPDGSRIVFSSGDGPDQFEIWVMDTNGADATKLTTYGGRDLEPAWSPDGRRIAWSRDGTLWLMRADGTDQRSLNVGGDRPAWVDDSTLLYDGGGIYRLNVDGSSAPEFVTAGTAPGVSGDRTRLAVVNGGAVWVGGIDGSGMAATAAAGALDHPSWASDGNWVLYQRGGAGLEAVRLTDGQVDTLVADELQARFPGWVPGPNPPTPGTLASLTLSVDSVLALGDSTQPMVDARDYGYRPLTPVVTYESEDPAVIEVGASGWIRAAGPGSTRVRVSSGPTIRSVWIPIRVGVDLLWSRTATGPDQVMNRRAQDSVGAPLSAFTTGVIRGALTISADGSEVLLGQGSSTDLDLRAVRVSDGTTRTLLAEAGNDYSPSMSPDGSRIAWARGDGLWVMNSDGTNPRQVSSMTVGVTTAWADDSTLIYATSGSKGGVYRIPANGTLDAKLDTLAQNGTGTGYWEARLSPDRTMLVMRDPVSRVLVRSLAATSVDTLPGSYGSPTWTRDGGWLMVTDVSAPRDVYLLRPTPAATPIRILSTAGEDDSNPLQAPSPVAATAPPAPVSLRRP